ncbi:hypothetical protein C7S14_5039 [Burkholderia cepacia]|nr:hypothetical protein C7S14_5039 [Burkholderia cepacia]
MAESGQCTVVTADGRRAEVGGCCVGGLHRSGQQIAKALAQRFPAHAVQQAYRCQRQVAPRIE